MNKIHYAFGKDYLKSWTIKDALREVFQNYIDYGSYHIETVNTNNKDVIKVIITNDYNPESLEFLRLGNTSKDSGDFIGHHGEGLKAAFLIFARENLPFIIFTTKYRLNSGFEKSEHIGETLYIRYNEIPDTHNYVDKFATIFECSREIYEDFINNIIKEEDILHSDSYYGDLLKPHKGKGNIFSGGLYVCTLENLNHSYNVKPSQLSLDRDRRSPSDWDVDYSTSRILESYNRSNKDFHIYTPADYNSRDYKFSSVLPEKAIDNIKAVNVNGNTQYYDETTNTMITNSSIKNTLDQHPKFKKVKELSRKEKIAALVKDNKRKGATTLLKEFKKKHCGNNEDMLNDIDVILHKLSKTKIIK